MLLHDENAHSNLSGTHLRLLEWLGRLPSAGDNEHVGGRGLSYPLGEEVKSLKHFRE